MFKETHRDTIYENTKLALTFISSAYVQAFPCGRRRSTAISNDSNGDGVSSITEQYKIPFDPEARLNTEANNRKHSSLNGYTQTYLHKWDKDAKVLSLSLAGYLFNITLTDEYIEEDDFGTAAFVALRNTSYQLEKEEDQSLVETEFTDDFNKSYDKLYANILLEELPLVSGAKNYYTEVLRNQSAENEPSLDLLCTNIDLTQSENKDAAKKLENYYFSGLSFSVTPFTDKTGTQSVKTIKKDGTSKKTIVSLCILEKDKNDKWICNQLAMLPEIKHGPAEKSILVNGLYTQNVTIKKLDTDPATTANVAIEADGYIDLDGGTINAGTLKHNGSIVPIIQAVPDESGNIQLQITCDVSNNLINC